MLYFGRKLKIKRCTNFIIAYERKLFSSGEICASLVLIENLCFIYYAVPGLYLFLFMTLLAKHTREYKE
jgi:hypothetical protein